MATAVEVAELLWPKLIRERGATFVAFLRPIAQRAFESYPNDLVGTELFVNHLHVLDWFENSAKSTRAPYWRRTHPDFARACRLAEVVGEAWAAKLGSEFPDKDFAVLVTRDDNPIVHFYEIRGPKDRWCDSLKNVPGSLIVIHSRSGRRTGSIRAPRASKKRA